MRIFLENEKEHLEPFGELADVPETTQLLIFQVNKYINKKDADTLENA